MQRVEQRTSPDDDGVPSLQLADQLALAARRLARALAAGLPADDFDLGVVARVPVVLASRARHAAITAQAAQRAREEADRKLQTAMEEAYAEHAERKRALEDAVLASVRGLRWHMQLGLGQPQPVPMAAPAVVSPVLALPEPPAPSGVQPSRDDSVPAPPHAAGQRPRRPAKTSRDDSVPAAKPVVVGKGIEPRPQKLPKKKATAVLEAAELVRDPDHRENHRWILRSGDTVLGYVEPTYGGASRSGRNGWTGRLANMSGRRCTTRDGAAADLAARWMRLVTAAPRRTVTGGY